MDSLNTRLWEATEEGKVDEIAALLDQGADIDSVDDWARTSLIQAIDYRNEAAALYLIQRGADVRLRDADGETALHGACRSGLEAVLRELLKRMANAEGSKKDVESGNTFKQRPLHSAAFGGHENIARLLVTEHGAQIDAKDDSGATPLLLALKKGNEGVASFLLSAGASCSVVDEHGWSVLHSACRGGLTSFVIRLLDEFGLDLHAKTKYGRSCLHSAANGGHVKRCRFLLERGLPVDELDNGGRSPLFDACGWGRISAAELLLDHGADIEHKDDRGTTPLCNAIIIGSPNREQVALLLIQHGARLDGSLPEGFKFASLDEGLAFALERGVLKTLFAEPDTPIPLYRRVLRWALTLPAVAALAKGNGWSLLGTAKTDEEVEEMIKKRLSLLRDDAWKRRRHLVIDRALDWGYGDSSKAPVPVLKKPRLDEKKEEEG